MPRIARSACSRASAILKRMRSDGIPRNSPLRKGVRRLLRRPLAHWFGPPAQDRFACGDGFIETATWGQPRRRMKARGMARAGLGGQRLQHAHELVERSLALSFSRLD